MFKIVLIYDKWFENLNYNNEWKRGVMVVRVLMLLLSLVILVNLCIITCCYITGENLYQKYGKQMLIIFGGFVFIVSALYVALALIALK